MLRNFWTRPTQTSSPSSITVSRSMIHLISATSAFAPWSNDLHLIMIPDLTPSTSSSLEWPSEKCRPALLPPPRVTLPNGHVTPMFRPTNIDKLSWDMHRVEYWPRTLDSTCNFPENVSILTYSAVEHVAEYSGDPTSLYDPALVDT